MVTAKMKLSRAYTSDLANKLSDAYKNLAEPIEKTVLNTVDRKKIAEVQVASFAQGSVVVSLNMIVVEVGVFIKSDLFKYRQKKDTHSLFLVYLFK